MVYPITSFVSFKTISYVMKISVGFILRRKGYSNTQKFYNIFSLSAVARGLA